MSEDENFEGRIDNEEPDPPTPSEQTGGATEREAAHAKATSPEALSAWLSLWSAGSYVGKNDLAVFAAIACQLAALSTARAQVARLLHALDDAPTVDVACSRIVTLNERAKADGVRIYELDTAMRQAHRRRDVAEKEADASERENTRLRKALEKITGISGNPYAVSLAKAALAASPTGRPSSEGQ